MTGTAKIVKVADQVVIRCPYNASLIAEIKGMPGRRWNPDIKAWAVPAGSEEQVRELVRKYFQIEGEESQVQYEIIKVRVTGRTSSKRSYCGGVTIDGRDLFSPTRGYLDTRGNDVFEILEQSGGFTYGDGYYSPYRGGHAFAVDYTLTLKVRKGAEWECTGRADYWGTYEILERTESNA